MSEIRTSKDGIDYLMDILADKPRTITRITLWKIPHTTHPDEVSLKIGRYVKRKDFSGITLEELESLVPKSELTLTDEEFNSLLKFLQNNFEPFKQGVKKYIPLDEDFNLHNIEHLKAFFGNPEKQDLLNFIIYHDIIPADLFIAFEQLTKVHAIEKFQKMLKEDLTEYKWQKWFTENSWVLGTEFVKILDEREIDTANISDFLMEAYDGFIDIVEIKRPEGNLKFWADTKDHNNYFPHSDLIKSITQASKYIYEVEREANNVKYFERVGCVKTIKPRCILIYGRSDEWNDEQKESYRILNSNYHNLKIMTYDHILNRAKRLIS
ncbi:MAG: DUF4263 domain-containing protein [Bacteroidales bacterium]|nr:DUF4263 domain-containing protein [Bacteroidales bacterium]